LSQSKPKRKEKSAVSYVERVTNAVVCLHWLEVNALKAKSLGNCLSKIKGTFTQLKSGKPRNAKEAAKMMGKTPNDLLVVGLELFTKRLRGAMKQDVTPAEWKDVLSAAADIASNEADERHVLEQVFSTTQEADGSVVRCAHCTT
jgi:hypothetical protein